MPFTIQQFADDLLGFMDEHRIEKAHLLGFSDGGNIAMVFAIKYPNRVNRLILNGANMCAEGVKRTVQIPIEIGYRKNIRKNGSLLAKCWEYLSFHQLNRQRRFNRRQYRLLSPNTLHAQPGRTNLF